MQILPLKKAGFVVLFALVGRNGCGFCSDMPNKRNLGPRERTFAGLTPQNSAANGNSTHSLTPDVVASGPTILSTVQVVLDDAKAEDIITIDLEGKSALADTMVIASGRSHRHVSAVADHVQRALKEAGHGAPRVEGLPHADWVLIDTGDVILHLFRPEVRSFYNMEKLWDDSFAEQPNA